MSNRGQDKKTPDEIFAALDATKDEPVLIETDRDRRPPQNRPALDAVFDEETIQRNTAKTPSPKNEQRSSEQP